jgi:2-iminoacetate synthase
VHTEYFLHAVELLKPYFSHISLEVQPLDEDEYRRLHDAGVNAILVYQETYNRNSYKTFHPKGKKSNFNYRLETPDRIGIANMHKIGLGVLLGLDDWRTDSFFCALHLRYLEKKFWQAKFSISFPRIRPAEGVTMAGVHMDDEELLQLIFAYRIFDPEVELSISTRETEKFRNAVIPFGVTSMSAGSKTNPGGYATEPASLEQFEIEDTRSAAAFCEVIAAKGYEPVWKDWDHVYAG